MIIICKQGHKHRTEKAVRYCKVNTEFKKIEEVFSTTPHSKYGTKDPIMDFDEFRDLFWPAISWYIKERDGEKCVDCGATGNLEVHHIIPRKDGGSDHPANLKTLCHDCHWKYHRGKKKYIEPMVRMEKPQKTLLTFCEVVG